MPPGTPAAEALGMALVSAAPQVQSDRGRVSALWGHPTGFMGHFTGARRVRLIRVRVVSTAPSHLTCPTRGGVAASESATFFFGSSAPDAGILAGIDGPSQAGLSDFTAAAVSFCFF